jgi:hypothetical protein
MSEIEMKDDVEIEEFTEELSDEALDREQGRNRMCMMCR